MRLILWVLIGILLVTIFSCGGASEEVSKSDFKGGEWPFSTSKVTLFCEEDAVWMEADGVAYHLTGWGKTYLNRTMPDLPVYDLKMAGGLWLYNNKMVEGLDKQTIETMKREGLLPRVSISPVISRAKELC